MDLRKSIQKNPATAKIIAAAIVFICGAVIFREIRSTDAPGFVLSATGKEFYSDNDGKTWFLADALEGSPFDHNGSQAYRVLVCRCGNGKPFVAFLAKYSDEQQAQIDKDHAQNPGLPSEAQMGPLGSLRRPGETKWFANSSPSISGYPAVRCPDGGDQNASVVSPFDPDSGATN
jgi:hypothetical protein